MLDSSRLPPGQDLTEDFPVLHFGGVPDFDLNPWDFKITGLVEREITINYKQLTALDHDRIISDFHCVTTWSRFDNIWEGVKSQTIVDLATLKPEANFVLIHCE
jgi:DMSO/TMAO reductase YedYZ molybdopterin-dependent catalytic subunit